MSQLSKLVWIGRASCGCVMMMSACPTETLAMCETPEDKAEEWQSFHDDMARWAESGTIEVWSSDEPFPTLAVRCPHTEVRP